MPSGTFYPSLSTILTVDSLPENLGFLQNGISNFLDKLYFRDYQFHKSEKGDSAFYSLVIVSQKRLAIEFPGTGLSLIFNPSHPGLATVTSEFPLSLSYEWPILKYINTFRNETFPNDVQSFFKLFLEIIGDRKSVV